MFTAFILLLLVAAHHTAPLPNVACQSPPSSGFPFCNTSLSTEARINDLISRVLDTEKPFQLTARHSEKIDRIGLPPYYWGINAIHGLGHNAACTQGKCPTSFPNPCGLGAMFNMGLVKEMGAIMSKEMRALYNLGATNDGLDTWSPNINILRDPRWGRAQEVPSEDPYLTGRYGVMYAQGVQNGVDSRYLFGVTTLKHFDAYSYEGPDQNRLSFNAIVSKYDLASTYMPQFKAAIEEGGALGVMCSYNALNGIPNCANNFLNNTLRAKWGFKGYISSDSGAVSFMVDKHHYVKTLEEAVADAINAGTDIDSGDPYRQELTQAVKDGKVAEATVNQALARTYRLRFRMGLFDPNSGSQYFKYGLKDINTPEAKALSQQMARETMVLLKNDNNILPFQTGKTVAVIGPNANSTANMMGNYLGNVCPPDSSHPHDSLYCVTTILDELTSHNAGGNTMYNEGCGVQSMKNNQIDAAKKVASSADYVVLVLGLDQNVEHEGHDRANIALPGLQDKLVEAIMTLKKPTVAVLLNGGIIGIDTISEQVPAIIEAWYPSTYGGMAISEVIFGKYNPSAKLPVTIYPSKYTSKIKNTDMNMTTGVGRSYRYFKGTPLFGFGHGLSYTTFNLTWKGDSPSTWMINSQHDTKTYSVQVQNTGGMSGNEVVMVYFKPVSVKSNAPLPIKQLIAFDKKPVNKGATTEYSFTVTASSLGLSDSDGNIMLMSGTYELLFWTGDDAVGIEGQVQVNANRVITPKEHMIGEL